MNINPNIHSSPKIYIYVVTCLFINTTYVLSKHNSELYVASYIIVSQLHVTTLSTAKYKEFFERFLRKVMKMSLSNHL